MGEIKVIEVQQEVKEFTVEEVFEALRQNGFKHIREQWVSVADGKVVGACVLGQAALNLGVAASDPSDEGDEPYTLIGQLNRFKVNKNSKWFKDCEDAQDRVGYLVVYWNDRRNWDQKKEEYGDFALATYQEVVDMAYDVMSPHFQEKIQLPHFEY